MPKKLPVVHIPENAKTSYLQGKELIQLREAAKLAGISPVILEMGRRLLAHPDIEGGIFQLPTAELQKRADEIQTLFVAGLRKIAKALSATPVKLKSYREENRLVFWYEISVGKGKVAG